MIRLQLTIEADEFKHPILIKRTVETDTARVHKFLPLGQTIFGMARDAIAEAQNKWKRVK